MKKQAVDVDDSLSNESNESNVNLRNPTGSKKISVKTVVGGNVKAAIKAAGGKAPVYDESGQMEVEPANYVELMRVAGVVNSVKTGTTTYGPWIAYVGDITAVNMVTGETFVGRQLLLPEDANLVLQEPVSRAVSENRSVEVAFAIEGAFARSSVGYRYRAKPLMPVENSLNSRAMQLLLKYGGDNLAKLSYKEDDEQQQQQQ